MTIVREIEGNIVKMLTLCVDNNITAYFAQGCNCFAKQGSGIAKQLRKFPSVYLADLQCKLSKKARLGTFTTADVECCKVFNMYTQYNYGNNGLRYAEYFAVGDAFTALNFLLSCESSGVRPTVIIPKIGAGLAGGDWEIISSIIEDTTPDIDIVVVNFNKGVSDSQLMKEVSSVYS